MNSIKKSIDSILTKTSCSRFLKSSDAFLEIPPYLKPQLIDLVAMQLIQNIRTALKHETLSRNKRSI